MEFQTVVFSDGIRNSDSFFRHHRQLIWILNSFACIRVIHKPNLANNLRRSDGSRSCWNWFRFDNSKNEDLFLSITDKKLRDKIQLVQTLDATIWWCACSQNKSPSGLSLRNRFECERVAPTAHASFKSTNFQIQRHRIFLDTLGTLASGSACHQLVNLLQHRNQKIINSFHWNQEPSPEKSCKQVVSEWMN